MIPPKLILVKHSLPVIDPEKPAHQWKLSPEGKKRCIPLAQASCCVPSATNFQQP